MGKVYQPDTLLQQASDKVGALVGGHYAEGDWELSCKCLPKELSRKVYKSAFHYIAERLERVESELAEAEEDRDCKEVLCDDKDRKITSLEYRLESAKRRLEETKNDLLQEQERCEDLEEKLEKKRKRVA